MIAAPHGITQTITAPAVKLCPAKSEIDCGFVTIKYVTEGRAFELHALAEFLQTFESVTISHEDFTREIAMQLKVDVTTTWTTAGMNVICEDNYVLR
jgi:NADPH-dependent 7-cyano-7-deazaguanine reductase QueF